MKTIYIVVGGSGQYEDYFEWDVKAFISKAKAEELLKILEEELKRVVEHNKMVCEKHPLPKNDGSFRDRRGRAHEGWKEEFSRILKLREEEITTNQYDSKMDGDLESASYFLKELELDESLFVEIVEN